MSLYNHVEIWKDRPEMWPKGVYCNGHIMVDAEKMAKSKGNFLMLLESVEEYSADATRLGLWLGLVSLSPSLSLSLSRTLTLILALTLTLTLLDSL
jgi:isoleucyl-tRNA synthetase